MCKCDTDRYEENILSLLTTGGAKGRSDLCHGHSAVTHPYDGEDCRVGDLIRVADQQNVLRGKRPKAL